MRWEILVLLGALFMFILYWVTRSRPLDLAEQKALAPFYMSYNQPIRDDQGGGFKVPDPFDYRGNSRKCLGCDPVNSEIMAGKVRNANELVAKKEKELQDYVDKMNDYVTGELVGGYA